MFDGYDREAIHKDAKALMGDLLSQWLNHNAVGVSLRRHFVTDDCRLMTELMTVLRLWSHGRQ